VRAQARHKGKLPLNSPALLFDGIRPAIAPLLRLIVPFQQVSDQDIHAAFQLELVPLPHILKFLGDPVEIDGIQLSRPK